MLGMEMEYKEFLTETPIVLCALPNVTLVRLCLFHPLMMQQALGMIQKMGPIPESIVMVVLSRQCKSGCTLFD